MKRVCKPCPASKLRNRSAVARASRSAKFLAKILKAEGWYSPKTTTYYIEYRVRRLREKDHLENVQTEDQNRPALPLGSPYPSQNH